MRISVKRELGRYGFEPRGRNYKHPNGYFIAVPHGRGSFYNFDVTLYVGMRETVCTRIDFENLYDLTNYLESKLCLKP